MESDFEKFIKSPEGAIAAGQSMTLWIHSRIEAQRILAHFGFFPPINLLPKECESLFRPEFLNEVKGNYLLDKTMYDMELDELHKKIMDSKK